VSRLFTTDDVITFDVGAAATIPTAAMSWAVLWKPGSSHRGGLIDATATGTRQFGINPFDSNAGDVFFALNGSTSLDFGAYIGGWALLAFTKAAGNATVRSHTYVYTSASWTHTDLAAVNVRSAVDLFKVGSFDAGQWLQARLAVMGMWAGTALADAQLQTLTGKLKAWIDLTPSTLWAFNQSSTATAVVDLMGSGADQSAIAGTAVSSDEPAGWSYSTTSGRRRSVTTYVRGTQGRLNDIMTTLGTTTPSLWPFWEATGVLVTGISVGDLIPSETAGAAEALEDDFAPELLPCGLYSYHFHPTGDHHLAGIDHANFSFGNGTVDTPFSVGAWIRPNAIVTNVIMGKYDSAGNLEEWRFFIDSAGLLSLELHDASASATEIAVSDAAMTIGQWVFVVATYDGGETAPVVTLYVDRTAVNDGSTTESGTYTAMENTAAPLTVGCSGVTATPVAEFHGRIALPFVTGKALTAAEVSTLYSYTAPMVGLI